jgi:hypothetical protein
MAQPHRSGGAWAQGVAHWLHGLSHIPNDADIKGFILCESYARK